MTFPDPAHFPSYRAPSEKEAPTFSDTAHRQRSAGAFAQGAATYNEVRPDYPNEVYALLEDSYPGPVLDCGAGTGKFTAGLVTRGLSTLACDPSADMLRQFRALHNVPAWRATAEATALGAGTCAAVTCAQTWHWVDVAQASAEMDRVIVPRGRLVLAWNTLDVGADPWILRLARIMHSGDIQHPGFFPEVASPWELGDVVRTTWSHRLTVEQLHLLMHTRAYWLRNGAKIRERMTGNLNWYLYEHMGFSPGQEVDIPYRTDAFSYRRGGDE